MAAAALGGLLGANHRPRLRWLGLLLFAAIFLRESIRGGWDVARRVLQPSLPVDPGFIRFASALPEGAPRYLFAEYVLQGFIRELGLVQGLQDDFPCFAPLSHSPKIICP